MKKKRKTWAKNDFDCNASGPLAKSKQEAAGLGRRASGCSTELEKWQPTQQGDLGQKVPVKEMLWGKNGQVLAALPRSLIGWELPEEWAQS